MKEAPPRFLHHAAILIFKGRNAHRLRRFQHGWGNDTRVRRRLHKDRAARSAVLRVWSAVPVFDAAIDIQDRVVAPGWIPGFGCKEVPIVLMPRE